MGATIEVRRNKYEKIPCGGFYVDDNAVEMRDGKPYLATGGSGGQNMMPYLFDIVFRSEGKLGTHYYAYKVGENEELSPDEFYAIIDEYLGDDSYKQFWVRLDNEFCQFNEGVIRQFYAIAESNKIQFDEYWVNDEDELVYFDGSSYQAQVSWSRI